MAAALGKPPGLSKRSDDPLATFIDDFVENQRAKNVREKTLKDYVRSLNTLIQIVGDKALWQIDKNDVVAERRAAAEAPSMPNSLAASANDGAVNRLGRSGIIWIDEWFVLWRGCLLGSMYGAPTIEPGAWALTGPVVTFDAELRLAATRSTSYTLGRPGRRMPDEVRALVAPHISCPCSRTDGQRS